MIKRQRLFLSLSAGVTALVVVIGSASATVSSSSVASINSTGVQGNAPSFRATISRDGRYIAFTSSASNLVSGDTNNAQDVFVRDTVSNTITRVSVTSSGAQANDYSQSPSISANGRYVAFESAATNLTSYTLSNATQATFVHDMQTGTTTLASVTASGQVSNHSTDIPTISGDGRFVAFQSSATNLSPVTTTIQNNIYVKDLKSGTLSLISKSGSSEANGYSENPSISCDGGIVAFNSSATNLTTDSNNGANLNVFLGVRAAGDEIENITYSQGTGDYAYSPNVSCDGNYVAYSSTSSSIVSGDTNGHTDVFRYSRPDDATDLVSVTSSSGQYNPDSYVFTINGDGSVVGWLSDATNTGASNSGAHTEAYIRNIDSQTSELVSKDSSGNVGNGGATGCWISSNGKVVAYSSEATNLISADGNGAMSDVFYANVN